MELPLNGATDHSRRFPRCGSRVTGSLPVLVASSSDAGRSRQPWPQRHRFKEESQISDLVKAPLSAVISGRMDR